MTDDGKPYDTKITFRPRPDGMIDAHAVTRDKNGNIVKENQVVFESMEKVHEFAAGIEEAVPGFKIAKNTIPKQ